MSAKSEEKESARLEAFSDGVFAVAITLLVLDIHAPTPSSSESLWEGLFKQWPSFLGFALSFATIGVMWMNHHRMFRLISRYEDGLAVVNGFLLLLVTFTPFPTDVFARNLTSVHAKDAAAFYSGCFVCLAVAFNLLAAFIHKHGLLSHVAEGRYLAESLRKRYYLGPGLYLALTLIAYVNVYACLAGHIALAIYWAIPARREAGQEV